MFADCINLTGLTFEDGDTDITLSRASSNSGIFASSQIETLYIGRNIKLKSYGNWSVFNGEKLSSVKIGCNVSFMPKGLFRNCYRIGKVDFDCSIIEDFFIP